MKRQQDEAYVLGTQELGDADLIVTLLAREQGRVRGVAKSARRSRRRFGGVLEPLTRVRAVWFEREGRDLHRIESLEGIRSFAEMQGEPVRQAACAVIAEVSTAFVHEAHGEPEAFRLTGAVLESLEKGGNPWTLLRYFEYWTLRLHGLLPDLSICSSCGSELGQEEPVAHPGHGLLCRRCATDPEAPSLSRGALELLGRMRVVSPDRMPRGSRRPRGIRGLEGLLRGTLESFAERTFRTYRHFTAAESFDRQGEDR